MDNSKIYIEMCKKARKAGLEENHRFAIKIFKYRFTFRMPIYRVTFHQDQLQEMIKGEKHCHLLAAEFAAYFHGTRDPLFFYVGRDNFTVDMDNSMEQMWLAFVMKEKYNKYWTGTEWEIK